MATPGLLTMVLTPVGAQIMPGYKLVTGVVSATHVKHTVKLLLNFMMLPPTCPEGYTPNSYICCSVHYDSCTGDIW